MKPVLCSLVLALMLPLCGCIVLEPKPHRFVETTNALPAYYLASYSAGRDGNVLLLRVTGSRGAPFRGVGMFKEAEDLYFQPVYDTVAGLGMPVSTIGFESLHKFAVGTEHGMEYRINMRAQQMPTNWHEHLYWLVETPVYPMHSRGFWSEGVRKPAARKRITVDR